MQFFKGCLQRQIHALGKRQVVAKMNYSAMRTRALLKAFPDARFVYIVRSPLETIPSHLTLHRNMFDHLFGLQRIPQPLLQQYYARRYQHNVEFYRYLEQLIEEQAVPTSQFLVIPYTDLRENLAGAMQRVLDFTGVECSDRLRGLIAEQAAQQQRYERAHKNSSLADFGLTHEQIVQDLAPIFDKYGFARTGAPA
jgi:hypothetical protein